jgi:tetratricopeptide (TPR) repeat protein
MNDNEIVDLIKKSFDLKNQGFYKPAIEMLYKALSIDNENLEILVQLGHLYKLLGNFQRSIYYIEKVLDINPNHLDCLYLLKEIYLHQNDLKSAKEISEKIYKIQPNPTNLAQKINILNKLHDFDEVKNIESSDSNLDSEVLYEIACAYCDNYDRQKALELLETAFKKNNKNEKIMLMLAKLYYDNKEFEKSQKTFTDLKK